MKVLIIEDELHNARRLENLLQQIDQEIRIEAVLESIAESVNWLQHHEHPNLAFMDVRLADGLSFEIFSDIDVKCPVIFTTAYDEYALRAFKVNSIDYLLKPVNIVELRASLGKFRQMTQLHNNNLLDDVIAILRQQQKNYRLRFLLPFKDSYITLMVSDIAYFYSEHRNTWAVMNNSQKYVLSYTMEELEDQLNPDLFFRANRQFLISSKAIEGIHNYFNGKLKLIVKPTGKENIVVSREKSMSFKKWIDR